MDKNDPEAEFDPRRAFWTDEKYFRLKDVRGSGQNHRVWISSGLAKSDVDIDVLRRKEGKKQKHEQILVALGMCYNGAGEVKICKQGASLDSDIQRRC